jgi:hypothetical protein
MQTARIVDTLRNMLVPHQAEPLPVIPPGLPAGWAGASLVERFGRTLITAHDVIDWYEDRQYWLWGAVDPADVPGLPVHLAAAAAQLVHPGPHHRRSLVTVFTACEGPLPAASAALIRAFRHRRSYRFRLHGSAAVRLLLAERESGAIIANQDARDLSGHVMKRKPCWTAGGTG